MLQQKQEQSKTMILTDLCLCNVIMCCLQLPIKFKRLLLQSVISSLEVIELLLESSSSGKACCLGI